MEEVQAELEVETIEEGWCGGGARRRRAGRRRAAVSAPARLAATVESERASEEGGRGQKRWRRRQCMTGWGLRRVGGTARRVRRCMDATQRARFAAVSQQARASGRERRRDACWATGANWAAAAHGRVSGCGRARERGAGPLSAAGRKGGGGPLGEN
jgi:hypothetical protein